MSQKKALSLFRIPTTGADFIDKRFKNIFVVWDPKEQHRLPS